MVLGLFGLAHRKMCSTVKTTAIANLGALRVEIGKLLGGPRQFAQGDDILFYIDVPICLVGRRLV